MNVMSSLAVHTLLQPSEDKHFLLRAVVAVIIQLSLLWTAVGCCGSCPLCFILEKWMFLARLCEWGSCCSLLYSMVTELCHSPLSILPLQHFLPSETLDSPGRGLPGLHAAARITETSNTKLLVSASNLAQRQEREKGRVFLQHNKPGLFVTFFPQHRGSPVWLIPSVVCFDNTFNVSRIRVWHGCSCCLVFLNVGFPFCCCFCVNRTHFCSWRDFTS